MARPKRNDLQKVTLNIREGDMEKMAQLFPDLGAGPAVRQLISAFVDKHFVQPNPVQQPPVEV